MLKQVMLPSLLVMMLLGTAQSQCSGSGDDDDDIRTPTPTPAPSPDPTQIPLPDGKCRSGTDCDNGQMCINPDETLPCGMCYPSEQQCTTNDECGDGFACAVDSSPCQCDGPGRICVAACTSTSCPDGDQCGADGLCEPIHCTSGTIACPDLSTCTEDAAGDGCIRWTCSTDTECGGSNVCVEGRCFDDFGYCSYPPP